MKLMTKIICIIAVMALIAAAVVITVTSGAINKYSFTVDTDTKGNT